MTRRIDRCPCARCKDWHVHPGAAVQGVSYSEDQARAVAAVLDLIDRPVGQTTHQDWKNVMDAITQARINHA